MKDTPVDTAVLGADGPEVGVQGLGCMGMSFAYGPTDTDQARATLERALELGVTLWDTADFYGAGDNERFLAPLLRTHRDQVVLATKCGLKPTSEGLFGPRKISNHPDYIRECVDASLSRLGVERIDLYYLHRRDVSVPLEESVGALAELVQRGKLRSLGLSEVTGDELRQAHSVHPISALQSEWSLFSRDVERTAVPAASELGVAVVPYSPLGRGFLTGSFVRAEKELGGEDFRSTMPRFTGENAAANAALLEPVREVAQRHGASPGQIALAWVHRRAQVWGTTVVPIPGTRRPARLEENTAATRVRLSEEDLALLDPIADRVAGDRYADMSSTAAGRE